MPISSPSPHRHEWRRINLNGHEIRKGASDAIANYLGSTQWLNVPPALQTAVDDIARSGGTRLVVAEDVEPLAPFISRTS